MSGLYKGRIGRSFLKATSLLVALALLCSLLPAQAPARTGADIAVASIGVMAGETGDLAPAQDITADGSYIVQVGVNNSGEEAAGLSVVLYQAEAGTETAIVGTQAVDNLAAGAEIALDFPWTPRAAGEYHLKAAVSAGGEELAAGEITATVEDAQVEAGEKEEMEETGKKTASKGLEDNSAPTLKSGVSATAYAAVQINTAYTLDLNDIFEDAESDPLTYTVKVDEADPAAADVSYSYTPSEPGQTTLAFTASDGAAESETYTVTLTVAGNMLMAGAGSALTFKVTPSTNQVAFYATTGFDSDGYDLYDPSSPLVAADKGVAGSYRVYEVQAPDTVSTISFRGTDASGNALGGMTVDLDDAADGVIFLRQAELSVSKIGDSYPTANQAKFMIKDADYMTATCGGSYVAGTGRTWYRYLLFAGGNAELYTYFTVPQGPLADTYATGFGPYKTVMNEPSIMSAFMSLPLQYSYTVTAPIRAKVQIFQQLRNFSAVLIDETGQTDNGDGTASHTYRLPGENSSLSYRVSMDGKITKAGYLPSLSANGDMTVTWTETDAPADTRANDVDSQVLAGRLEESVLLNVNSQNYLELVPGETFRLRAYRVWQIVNTDTANIMIEPDFHCNVISDGNVVSINPVTEGNGNGSGNWLDITALRAGTALIEISYDAIDIGGDTSFTGVYAASDPRRTGLLVIKVGADGTAGIDLGIGSWDAEYDTLYFNGASGEFKLSPSVSGSSVGSVTVLNNPTVGGSWTDLTAADGVYTAAITPGNNILRIAAGDAVEYQIVRGAAVTTVIENVTDPGRPAESGDTVKVSFEGLYMPIPKFSGIYNPGYHDKPGDGHYIAYTLGPGVTLVSQEHEQYNFISKHALTLTVAGDGPYPMTGGHIFFNVMGVSEPVGGHRLLNDAGAGANFNAVSTYHNRSILPDVTLGLTSPAVKPGDINGNGYVNSADATLLARYLVGLASLTDDQTAAADTNGNSYVNSADATLLARYLVGLIQEF